MKRRIKSGGKIPRWSLSRDKEPRRVEESVREGKSRMFVHKREYKCEQNNYHRYANDLVRLKSLGGTRAEPADGFSQKKRSKKGKKKRGSRGRKEAECINAHIHATRASARKITVVICGNSGSRLFLRPSRRVVRRRVDLSNDRANLLHSIIINGSPYKVSA